LRTAPFQSPQAALGKPYVFGLETFGALHDVEGDRLAFLKAAKAVALDSGEMHEDILAIRPAEKAEAFRVVKPLHCTLFHLNLFLLRRCTAELNLELIASKAGKRNKQEIQIGFFDLLQYSIGASFDRQSEQPGDSLSKPRRCKCAPGPPISVMPVEMLACEAFKNVDIFHEFQT
jgi:hypothetical protein